VWVYAASSSAKLQSWQQSRSIVELNLAVFLHKNLGFRLHAKATILGGDLPLPLYLATTAEEAVIAARPRFGNAYKILIEFPNLS